MIPRAFCAKYKDLPEPSTSFSNRLNNVFTSSASSESSDESEVENKDDDYSYGSSTASYHSDVEIPNQAAHDETVEDDDRSFSDELSEEILAGLSRAISSTPINQPNFDETLHNTYPQRQPTTADISRSKHSRRCYSFPTYLSLSLSSSSTLRLIQPMDEHQGKRFKGEQIQNQDFNGKSEAKCAIPEKQMYMKWTEEEEIQIQSIFFAQSLDEEDIDYLKRAHDELVKRDTPATEFLRQIHWVDDYGNRVEPHDPKMEKHATGCARTEGFYKIDPTDKTSYFQKTMPDPVKSTNQTSKEA